VVLGLLYGRRDPDQTIVISCRGGMDSDCNPSSAGGVLFTTLGFENLPARFNTGLDEARKFSHTAYSFPELLDVCEKLAREFLQRQGGRVERTASGEEVFVIPIKDPVPTPLELSWAPGPIAQSRFTADEMAQITYAALPPGMKEAVAAFAPDWQIKDCGPDMNPGLRDQWEGRPHVLCVHPLDAQTGCVLSRTVTVPAGQQTLLRLLVGHDPRGDFDLIVRVNDDQILHTPVNPTTCQDGRWLRQEIDLTPYAGREIKIELVNQPTGWSYEAAYWGEIAIVSR
jgi:hypothetical protein